MKTKSLAAPYLVWMILFTVVPLGIVVWYAFTDSITGAFTFGNIARSRSSPACTMPLPITMIISFIRPLASS